MTVLGLNLSGCGTQKNKIKDTSSSSQEETTLEKSSSKKESQEISKKFLDKIKFANYVGSDRETASSPKSLEKFEELGALTNIDKDNREATVLVPCYDENGNIYSNIYAGTKLYSYSNSWEDTCLVFSGLPKTISENIVEFNGIKYGKNDVLGSEINKDLWIPTKKTDNTIIDSNGKKFQIHYNEKNLLNGQKQIEEQINEKSESDDVN